MKFWNGSTKFQFQAALTRLYGFCPPPVPPVLSFFLFVSGCCLMPFSHTFFRSNPIQITIVSHISSSSAILARNYLICLGIEYCLLYVFLTCLFRHWIVVSLSLCCSVRVVCYPVIWYKRFMFMETAINIYTFVSSILKLSIWFGRPFSSKCLLTELIGIVHYYYQANCCSNILVMHCKVGRVINCEPFHLPQFVTARSIWIWIDIYRTLLSPFFYVVRCGNFP